ncbi:hypothetical protein PV433_31145 [Paenibacillus sp. GYB004]|uniref:RCC1 domain-containing protein n=1 Tax=Paenibacillus sp. GYB004 TaxID=2994393 RepID=UPI002F96BFC7
MYKRFNGGIFPQPGIPQKVPKLKKVTYISYGVLDTLAVTDDGSVWSWGVGYQQFDDGGGGSYFLEPLKIPNLQNIVKVSASHHLNAALDKDGKVWVWRLSYSSKGRGTDEIEPQVIDKLTNIVDIIQSGQNSLTVLKEDRTVWTWSLIGVANTDSKPQFVISNAPTQVEGLTDIVKIASGPIARHQLALKQDGTVWIWGYNEMGQLGKEPSLAYEKVPSQVGGLHDVIDISAGTYHSLALKKDGTVWKWGTKVEYGAIAAKVTPIPLAQVKGLTDIRTISSGTNHDAAIKQDGTLWIWGDNYFGQLGDGTNLSKETPAQVVFP